MKKDCASLMKKKLTRLIAIYKQFYATYSKRMKNHEFSQITTPLNLPIVYIKKKKENARSAVLAVPPAAYNRANGAVPQHAVQRPRRPWLLAAQVVASRERILLGVLSAVDSRLRS